MSRIVAIIADSLSEAEKELLLASTRDESVYAGRDCALLIDLRLAEKSMDGTVRLSPLGLQVARFLRETSNPLGNR